ncbi:122_t:CDS:2, partial [Racocetra fulgida]
QKSNNIVDWNHLRTSDLKAMCFKKLKKKTLGGTGMVEVEDIYLESCQRRRLDCDRKNSKIDTNEGDEFKNLLIEARKQMKLQGGDLVPYNRRSWQTKDQKFGAWGSRTNHYTSYLSS